MTRLRTALLGMAGLALVVAQTASANEITNEINVGKAVVPVTLTIPAGVDPNSVYLGSYIVNVVADCNGCHSNNEYVKHHDPFIKGQKKEVNATCYLNGGQAFGPFISRNITPVSGTTMPAGLTFAEFRRVLLTGQDPQDPGTLLQVMPWDAFQNMTINEMQAIYNYLSSIPSLPDGGGKPC